VLRELGSVRAEILAAVTRAEPRPTPLRDALGLVLATPVEAAEAVPPFANSAMDGYAVRAADTTGASADRPVHLTVVGELPAGRAPTLPVEPGEAIRIMTGAPVPDGADAIVMVERTQRDGPGGVHILAPARAGDHVRAAGGDVAVGERVFAPGAVLSPAHLGVLASLGCDPVTTYGRPRVGVLSTGDELREGPAPLAPGEIRDSNRPMLLALVADAGCEPVDLGTVRDDEAALRARFDRALSQCDALVTSGGVSVGDYDVVKAVLDRLGVLQWWQIAIKPAKPLAFGTLRGSPVFGLPGNPVSSHVSFELFARPALRTMMGDPAPDRARVRAVADEPMPRSPDGKVHFDRVRVTYVDGGYHAVRRGAQASNALAAMAAANGLAVLPDGDGVAAGTEIEVLLLS